MASPYRTPPGVAPAAAPTDRGIVGDIVDQFADRFAFYRELVQNAIDAETPSVEVTIDTAAEGPSGNLRVSVADQGIGMTRDILENRLLVLFRSTKENDPGKIGKFGVGFASVLAMRPNLVRVTSTHGGVRHTLHLFPDLSYELFESGRSNRTGTTVEIELDVPSETADQFVANSGEALGRWCCHADTPIFFDVRSGAHPGNQRVRINRPLDLPRAVAVVSATSSCGQTRAVVGIPGNGKPTAGFYNHGLMLHETPEPLAGKLSFKVQDSRLGPTISRDNVRRDRVYEVALDFVRNVARRHLGKAASEAVRAAAEDGSVAQFVRGCRCRRDVGRRTG